MTSSRVAAFFIVVVASGDASAQTRNGTATVAGPAGGGPTSDEITAEEPLYPWRTPPGDAVEPDERVAPSQAFEIGVHGGVTLPYGSITGSRRIADVVDAGGSVGLSLAYRASPYWSFGWTGTFHESSSDDSFIDDMSVRGATSGLFATFHARPYSTVDPFITVGGGYRTLWFVPEDAPTRMLHGFELARVAVGMDFRMSPSFAFGPELGADLNFMPWEDRSDTSGDNDLSDPGFTTFFFAGAQGRFDVGGERVTSSRHRGIASVEGEPAPR